VSAPICRPKNRFGRVKAADEIASAIGDGSRR
jgi:hypothetical protein